MDTSTENKESYLRVAMNMPLAINKTDFSFHNKKSDPAENFIRESLDSCATAPNKKQNLQGEISP